MTARRNERGIALVVVLWVGLLVAAIAGAFILDTRTSTKLTRNFLDNTQARALADGGVHMAIHELTQTDRETVWARDGRRYRKSVPGGILDIAIEDEAGKIDINEASGDLLEGLFRSAGLESGQAEAVVEAIDNMRNVGSADGNLLRAAGIPERRIRSFSDTIRDGSRNGTAFRRAFQSVDGLGQVPGITPSIYARVRPAVTVYGGESLHYLSAPRESLLAIPDMPSEAVDAFLEARIADDPILALNDFLLQGKAREFGRAAPSQFVTVKVVARSDNGATFTRIAVVEMQASAFSAFIIKDWREGDLSALRPPQSARDEAFPRPEGES